MPLTATRLRTNARIDPLGIDSPAPRFSWQLESDRPGVIQRAYRLRVWPSEDFDAAPTWDSRLQDSDLPYGVGYAGPALASAHRYFWRVRVWAAGDAPGDWSPPAWFETALLDPIRWAARWIGAPGAAPRRDDDAVLYLRGGFALGAEVVRARAYVSALGWYRFFVNGADVTGPALVPRWTPLDDYVEYQTYDITGRLRGGDNIVAMAVGDGRYRGRLGVFNRRAVYGDRLAGLVQIEADLADGTRVTAVSDGGWHAGPGRILGSDPKAGEHADLRIPDADWLTDPLPPARFRPAAVLPRHRRRLVAEEVGRVRCVDRLAATVRAAPSGAQIVDFGQNFAGVARIRLPGPAGSAVRLTHSELLTPEGELDTSSLNASVVKPIPQRDEVVLAGRSGTDDWYQPWFTVHGFRYLEVAGLEHRLRSDDVEGVVLSSDLRATGRFECSDERLNRLHRNVMWSLRSNFTDTPTDCPTRERSGWTGDAQTFAATAATLVDAEAYLWRYLRNLAAEQLRNGSVPPIVPSETSGGVMALVFRWLASSTGWGDAAVLLPWTLYRYYGDAAILARQYPSMRAWVDYLERKARTGRGRARWFARRLPDHDRYILGGGYHWGEWLRPGEDMPKIFVGNAIRPSAVVATAYFAHSAGLLARTAEVLGHRDDARRYGALADRVGRAWRAAFVGADGRVGEDRQDDYVRALAFDLLTPAQRPAAVARLVELIERAGHHLGTGFLSTPMLLPVLADNGRLDAALRLLLQNTSPSWLYQVEHGATTTWETWEGYRRGGRGKDSHNHYAFGVVAGWLTEGLAGLAPARPGYRHIRIKPGVGGGITRAAAELDTPFGTVASSWRLADGRVRLEVSVPPGATADIHQTDGDVHRVGSGNHSYSWAHPDTAR